MSNIYLHIDFLCKYFFFLPLFLQLIKKLSEVRTFISIDNFIEFPFNRVI
jgi:hypothetical protein